MSVVVDNTSGEITVEIPEDLPTATLANPNTDTYNDFFGIKPPFGLPTSVMPGEVPYTSTLPYLVHPGLKTHPTFVPPSDNSSMQAASPLFATFVPHTQVGGYAGMNAGYAGNTYLPDQQPPVHHQLGGGAGLSTGTRETQVRQIGDGMWAQDMVTQGPLAQIGLAPSEQAFTQAAGQQLLSGQLPMVPLANARVTTPSWQHGPIPVQVVPAATANAISGGSAIHLQPTTFAGMTRFPSAFGMGFH